MADTYVLSDDNSGFVLEIPVTIPIIWRTRTVQNTYPWGTPYISAPIFSGQFTTFVNNKVVYSAWTSGGEAGLYRRVCRYQSILLPMLAKLKEYGFMTTLTVAVVTAYYLYTEDINAEIDWYATFKALRLLYPPEYYTLGSVRLVKADLSESQNLVSEGLVDLDMLKQKYANALVEGEKSYGQLLSMPADIPMQKKTMDLSSQDGPTDFEASYYDPTKGAPTIPSISGVNRDFSGEIPTLGLNSCIQDNRTVYMYLRVWVKSIVAIGGGSTDFAQPEAITQSDTSDASLDDVTGHVGSSVSGSSIGAQKQGLNKTFTNYGNTQLDFDSVYLTGTNYSGFVAAGGGIISEAGVFPINQNLYIESVKLSLDGSTMTVVEIVDFDAQPSLSINQKLYGYLFDDTHSSKPIFCGYVSSFQRTLNGETQQITYECRDLLFYLNQMYSPSVYHVQAGDITYSDAVKSILNTAGLSTSIVNLPTVDTPEISWLYEPLKNILDWATKYFGKYVYFQDRHGRLNIRATDSGSFIKNIVIPSVGTAISSSHRTMSFNPITDYSRARNQVILTGDFSVTETTQTLRYNLTGPVHLSSAVGRSGFYWDFSSIGIGGATQRKFYFVFNTKHTLLEKLLSMPNESAQVTLTMTTYWDTFFPAVPTTVTLPITSFQTAEHAGRIICAFTPGDFPVGTMIPIEMNGSSIFTGQATTGRTEYTFNVTYAYKSDNPIQVTRFLGYGGGIEVIKRPEFKDVNSPAGKVSDKLLMEAYLDYIKEFYKPIYGGSLEMDGLDLDVELLGKVSVTGTNLSATEASNLIIYGITYDVVKQKTSLELSNKVFSDLPYFDVLKERARSNNESLVKLGLLEQKSLYNT